MDAKTFIRIIEDEYSNVVKESESLKLKNGFTFNEKPTYICNLVQRFRNWVIFAIRSVDLQHQGSGIAPEDAVIHAAVTHFEENSEHPVHPSLREALSVFNKEQLDAIFGETRRLILEQKTKLNFDECSYKVCHSHCQFVKDVLFSEDDAPRKKDQIRTRFTASGNNSEPRGTID